jgi:hypothetical protein
MGAWQSLCNLVREQLGPDLQDTLAPLRDGGLMLHTIFGIMHDTCATANLVAELMASVRNEVGQDYYGLDGKDNKAKPMFDFLCGNHTRNLLA